ncbi:selenocysteine-specific translation elongation factor [Aquitalea sp. LB_tupeE]|uniref:selenocysteine-specific translation elongation factor n=1 Tax=Aquitalea sp. LB_tupeE TaxID=2748078 RepID=UPI0015BB509F|nr:selenocysteine-specific translation elongation factor [Aquitalea sp. LB_tupeE]NWK77049.1 selenocysteine-specific translation elongation factor [Aquitalea sp. LB_tupeE]
MIFATAGHVDHGKTSLLTALTGHDADRLPEEKKRGMTIDLGYVYLPLDDGRIAGFIDVPGHEKFLGNMLCGLSGIPHALLVIAADDGIMPQTREHLAILQLSGIPRLTVVISKCDLVDEASLQAQGRAVRHWLQDSPWPYAPLFHVSSQQGLGIAQLRQYLLDSLQPPRPPQGQRFRLAIDRAFTLSGAGLVVTGTALNGQVSVGDRLWLSGLDTQVRVRSLHVQNATAQSGQAGQRIALNLAGDVQKQDIQRGDWLFDTRPPAPSQRITVQLHAIDAIKHWQAVHIHHAARHITGRVCLLDHSQLAATDNGLAELVLDQPLWLADGDRLILRDASARHTIAGAQVLELQVPERGKRQATRLDYLRQLLDPTQTLAAQLQRQSEQQAVALDAFAWAKQLDTQAMQSLLQTSPGQQVEGWLYHPTHWQSLQNSVLERLAMLHQQQPDQLGASRGRLRRLALPKQPEAAVQRLLSQLLQQGQLCQTRGWLHLPGHVLSFSAQEQEQWQRLAPCFTSKEPQWVRDLAHQHAMEETDMRRLLHKAARLGHVVAVVQDRYFATQHVHQMADIIRALCEQHGHADAASFRDQLGCGRKLAIQILEFYDRSGFTRRLADRHLLRESMLFGSASLQAEAPAAGHQ